MNPRHAGRGRGGVLVSSREILAEARHREAIEADRSVGGDPSLVAGDVHLLLRSPDPFDPGQEDPFRRLRDHDHAIAVWIQLGGPGDPLESRQEIYLEPERGQLLEPDGWETRVRGRGADGVQDDLPGQGGLGGDDGPDAAPQGSLLADRHENAAGLDERWWQPNSRIERRTLRDMKGDRLSSEPQRDPTGVVHAPIMPASHPFWQGGECYNEFVKVSPISPVLPPKASLIVWRGWEIPDHFGDPVDEVVTVRHAAGLFDRPWRALMEVRGRDRASFLHAMLTNDIKALQPGQGCEAAFLTVQGKPLAFLRVHVLADRIYLELDDDVKGRTLEALERFLISERVEFEDVSAEWTILSIEGPRAPEILHALRTDPLPDSPSAHGEGLLGDVSIRIVRAGESGEIGFDLWVPPGPASQLWQQLLEIGKSMGLRPAGFSALNTLRVEAGVPWYGIDVTEEMLVLEAPSERIVSFTKGCYVGQEVVARITYRGHVNRKLTGLTFPDGACPPQGATVFAEGQEIGVVTSPVYSPTLKSGIALALLRREWLDPGRQVEVRSQTATWPAAATALPFYRRD